LKNKVERRKLAPAGQCILDSIKRNVEKLYSKISAVLVFVNMRGKDVLTNDLQFPK